MEWIEKAWKDREEYQSQALAESVDAAHGGYLDVLFSRRIREAASWSLVSTLAQRHPGTVFVTLASPREGVVYDCLRILLTDGGVWFDVNRLASGSALLVRPETSGEAPLWGGLLCEWMSADDRGRMIRKLENWIGMGAVPAGERPTRRDVAYAVLASFLAAHLFDPEVWSVQGCYATTSGEFMEPQLAAALGLPTHYSAPYDLPVTDRPETNVFALFRSGKMVASVDTSAHFKALDGRPRIDLARLNTATAVARMTAAIARS